MPDTNRVHCRKAIQIGLLTGLRLLGDNPQVVPRSEPPRPSPGYGFTVADFLEEKK